MLKLTSLFGGDRSSEPKASVEAVPDGGVGCLRDVSNITRQRMHPLLEPVVIVGRRPEEPVPVGVGYVLIRQVVVGRKHAMIERRSDGYWLSDCGSVNGTFLNGDRVGDEPVRLKVGDRLRFYEYEFEYLEEQVGGEGAALTEAQRIRAAERQAQERSGGDDDDTLLYQ